MTRPLVSIWSPAASALVAAARDAGWDAGEACDAALAIVDARGEDAPALAALAAAAAPARLALVADAGAAWQDRLIAAGATQIAVVGPAGEGLVPALRLAERSLAADARGRRRAATSALDAWLDERLARGEAVGAIHVAMVRLDLVDAAHGRDAATALIEAAERRVIAQVDAVAEDDGTVARRGAGFVAAIAGPPDRTVTAAARIEEALARPFRLGAAEAVLGARLGLAGARPGEDAAGLLARAAAGIGEAAPDPGDDPLAVDVHRAIGGGEVTLLFQPQATTADGTLVGVEALVRWRHPTHGVLGAEPLLAAAARAGIGVGLSEHIQRRVLDAVAAWSPALTPLRVALNLTAADLARPGFVDTFLAHVDASGVARERLTLEVTETELMADLDPAAAVLAALQAAGCRTAIDDFGTGYSSLAYLATLPIDYLKLDRALVGEVTGPERGQVVVRAAIEMARSLGLALVAEGVETEAQRAALAAAGCGLYQGFLLAPPLTGAALAAMVEERS